VKKQATEFKEVEDHCAGKVTAASESRASRDEKTARPGPAKTLSAFAA
jgi:hypothetical protein